MQVRDQLEFQHYGIAQRSTGFDLSTEGLRTVTKKLWLGYVYLFMQLVNAGIYKSEHRFHENIMC
jgi:hypothetical protein